jgi:hypothetical protein
MVYHLELDDEVYFWGTLDNVRTSRVLNIFNNNDKRGRAPTVGLRNCSTQILACDVVKVSSINIKVSEIIVGDLVAIRLGAGVSIGEVISISGKDIHLKDPITDSSSWGVTSTIECVVKVQDGKKSMIKYMEDMK